MKTVLLLAATVALMAQDKTGLAAGARIPEFELPDQQGVLRKFTDLRGPNGLVLAFTRSADW
jgi:peroxiredoxin